MSRMKTMNVQIVLWTLLLVFAPVTVQAQEEAPPPTPTPAAVTKRSQAQQEISKKEQEIAELNRKIRELQGQHDDTAAQAEAIQHQVELLTQQLDKARLELRQTQLTIDEVQGQQHETKEKIRGLEEEIVGKREQLKALVRTLYEHEQQSLIRVFFDTLSLSEVLATQAAYQELQEKTNEMLSSMRHEIAQLKSEQEKLVQHEEDLSQLAGLLSAQKADISAKQQEQEAFYQVKKTEQASYEHLIKEAQEARKEIEQQIFTLQGAEDIEVPLTSAFDMARYASSLTGVRASLLLGVLKVESNLGQNTGSGVFPDDMHPASREAFVRITSKLGLDLHKAPIARRPSSGQGWGGAVGPAQIMPATWETIEGRLEALMKKSPVNPYELTDAFVATALFLADREAADKAKEREAVGRYIAGSNWEYYGWYIDRVMAVAKEYENGGV